MSLEDTVRYALAHPQWALDELDKADCRESLLAFTRRHWHILEPNTVFVDGWALEALCEHLEAVTRGDINRLLVNVPPGFMKSLLTNVFWPAWEWSAAGMPWLRYVTFSYAASLTYRDNGRFRDLLIHPEFQRLWGDRFTLRKIGEERVSNDRMGWKLASSVGGVGTGERGDRVILDDPHNVKEAESDVVRQETVRWFREGMSNRLNDMEKSAIVVIMQRVHECLLPGTMVRTRDGERAIELIAAGDKVYGSNGWQRVVAAASRPFAGQVYGVMLYGHPTTCWTTGDHLYRTERGWIRADELTAADWVALPIPPSMAEVEWEEPLWADPPRPTGTFTGVRAALHAAPTVERERLVDMAAQGLSNSAIAAAFGVHRNTIQCYMGHYGIRRMRDQNPLLGREHLADPDFWRLVGYWIAEGSIVRGRGGEPRGLRITFGDSERSFCDDVVEVLGRYGLTVTVSETKKSVLEPYSGCSQLARWLAKHFGLGAHGKHLPEFVFALSSDCQEQLLEGWVRGDGFYRGKEASACSVSHALIHDFQRLALGLGYNARVVPTYASSKLNVIDGRISVSSGNGRELRFIRTADNRRKMRIENGVCWVKVRSIETKEYSGPVYDIETPSHDFVVGNATVHNCDVSGAILESAQDYEHLMIPMEWDGRRYHTSIGWTDPREDDGDLAWPERFSRKTVEGLKEVLGPFGYAGQYQQAPVPRGGGIIKREYWQLWGNPDNPDDPQFRKFPPCAYIVASLDGAFTEKQENDACALTVWGLFYDQYEMPRAILMHAWQDRLTLHDCVEKVNASCKRFKVDRLLIENKANGISVSQELRRLYAHEGYAVQLIEPKGDKVARTYSVEPIFADEMIYAPDRSWADMVITQMAAFPKGTHDDLHDSSTQAIKHLRDIGLLVHGAEIAAEMSDQLARPVKEKPLYPV